MSHINLKNPTNNDTIAYTYDAMGRRLTKKFTNHVTEPLSLPTSSNSEASDSLSFPPSFKGGRGVQNPRSAKDGTLSPSTTNTDVTTYKYHYIGGQITEIEIDSIRNPGEGQTVLRNEEVKIHLGANSQPISYEWVKHVGESTTSATYYYHYDIHGNVLKVTDSSENTKITYTYDTLGKILTETNPDSILNFFTFRGASQTIWDNEVGMYYSGGYYRPDTGTALQGTGAPVLTNPASSAMLKAMAKVNQANMQLKVHAMVSASSAGSSSGGAPGGFSPPAGPSDGIAHSGKAPPPQNPDPAPESKGEVSKYGLGPTLMLIYNSETGTWTQIGGTETHPWNPFAEDAGKNDFFSDTDDNPHQYAVALTPIITEETDASQLQPEQSDETFEAVYVWDKPGEKGSSQAVNAVDTGVPGGGGEMRLMNPLTWWQLIEKAWNALPEWVKALFSAVLGWLIAVIDFSNPKDQVIAGFLGTKSFKFRLEFVGSGPLYPGKGLDTLKMAKAKGPALRERGWKLVPGSEDKFRQKFAPGMPVKDFQDFSANDIFDLVIILAAIEYDSIYGVGAAGKDPAGFEKWLLNDPRAQEFRDFLIPFVGPPKPESPGDYPIEIQPIPIIPQVTTTSFYRIREIHNEKVQV